jgi:hypothetical protein
MREEIKHALLSLSAGILMLAALYSIGMLIARYPDNVIGFLGYLLVALLTLPLFGLQQPPVWLLLLTAAIDVWFLTLPIWLISYLWPHRRGSRKAT